jgi:hypothetical protein
MATYSGKQLLLTGLIGISLGFSGAMYTANKYMDRVENSVLEEMLVDDQSTPESIKEYAESLTKTRDYEAANLRYEGMRTTPENAEFISRVDGIVAELKGDNYSKDSYRIAKEKYREAFKTLGY